MKKGVIKRPETRLVVNTIILKIDETISPPLQWRFSFLEVSCYDHTQQCTKEVEKGRVANRQQFRLDHLIYFIVNFWSTKLLLANKIIFIRWNRPISISVFILRNTHVKMQNNIKTRLVMSIFWDVYMQGWRMYQHLFCSILECANLRIGTNGRPVIRLGRPIYERTCPMLEHLWRTKKQGKFWTVVLK